jgi:hypothetical protein
MTIQLSQASLLPPPQAHSHTHPCICKHIHKHTHHIHTSTLILIQKYIFTLILANCVHTVTTYVYKYLHIHRYTQIHSDIHPYHIHIVTHKQLHMFRHMQTYTQTWSHTCKCKPHRVVHMVGRGEDKAHGIHPTGTCFSPCLPTHSHPRSPLQTLSALCWLPELVSLWEEGGVTWERRWWLFQFN